MAEVLQAHWLRALRLQGRVAVAMIDIDHFKSYNDRYGHVAGDTCLQRVATALSANIRDEDTVARYGGEEFAVILPDADAAAAYAVAERVRVTVQALDEPHAASPAGTVTVSIGVAVTVPRADTTVEDLIKCADALLYEAKRNGRNQVVAG
jgi:diguanylate cyclase (GGDEF)-like protein